MNQSKKDGPTDKTPAKAKATGREPTIEEMLAPRFQLLLEHVKRGKGNGVYRRVMASVEKPLVKQALAATGGNQIQAAALLGINRNTLKRRMDKLGLKR